MKYVIYSNIKKAYLEYDFAGYSWQKETQMANKFHEERKAIAVMQATGFADCIIVSIEEN